jgi:hypothetical protein
VNVQDAAYITGQEYPGGCLALGPRIGVSGAVLANKLNPNLNSHHLTVAEAMRIMMLSGDTRILHAMATELHHMAIPLPTVAEEDVMHAMTKTIAEFGSYLKAVTASLEDGRVTKLELRHINKEMGDLMAHVGYLMSLLEAKERNHER